MKYFVLQSKLQRASTIVVPGFLFVSSGPGARFFVGSRFPPRTSSGSGGGQPDDLPDSKTRVLGVYMEVYWSWPVLSGAFRLAPRVAWVREFRDAYPVSMNSFGLGGAVAGRNPARHPARPRTGCRDDSVVFDSEEVRRSGPDLDGVVINWIWEGRAGLVYRIH